MAAWSGRYRADLMKRAFDVVMALLGLVLLSPILFAAALMIKFDSPGPIFFIQERMGRHFKPFFICKLRTMVHGGLSGGAPITFGNDPRITRVGRYLRKTKIDEIPQLVNVLRGEMSFVGPRPEIRKYVELFRQDYEEILKIRPGITDMASLKYQDEAGVLGQSADPEDEYVRRILPDKIELAKEYVARSSFLFDIGVIVKTIPKLFGCEALS
jgi:lipopolysaccharide/colanic/teichoic acid biosynthesis glycosyltransferase